MSIRKKFDAFWSVMQYVPTDNALWTEAENLLWQMDREGRIVPLTDVLIACCARRAGAVVLTFDTHFYDIPNTGVISDPAEY